MLIMAIKPGHDGSIAVLRDKRLLYCLESEKDSFLRYSDLTPSTILEIAERLDSAPDIVGLGGWRVHTGTTGSHGIGAGYYGLDAIKLRLMRFFGKETKFFSSSHERSHIMMAIGMAPRSEIPTQAVLVWEGNLGNFYLINKDIKITHRVPVMHQPGQRYAFLFDLANPNVPDGPLSPLQPPRTVDAGKLMALAAYGNAAAADADIRETVQRILKTDITYPCPKEVFRDSLLYNAGVESEACKIAAAFLSEKIFQNFASVAKENLPAGLPLRISGGCGLNCDWNTQWVEFGHFSSIFVPPCTNDSGSALGTAIDAQAALTGDPCIEWDVYSGLEFVQDTEPDHDRWNRISLDYGALAQALAQGHVTAWVQGRWEMGPRALGNRSILAEPFNEETKHQLNAIKQREGYRPIAPCCRIEDLSKVFHKNFDDPYMLYFRRVRLGTVKAITHIDGSARVQTVSSTSNQPLHRLLSEFARRSGVGVLCNTSLNFSGHGFINRMSDLIRFCEQRRINDIVVGNVWYQARD